MAEVMARGPNFVFAREFIENEHGVAARERRRVAYALSWKR